MVRMRYGSALGTFREHIHCPNTPKCIGVQLGTFREHLCSPNVPNALPQRIRTIFMFCMCYGNVLSTFREHRRSPNVPNRTPKYLGVFGQCISSLNVPNALP